MEIKEIEKALEQIKQELVRAKKKFPKDFNSVHEGWAVIKEEEDELWEEVRAKNFDPKKGRTEAMQTAAMCVRFMVELCKEEEE